jgi:hypothetical protein
MVQYSLINMKNLITFLPDRSTSVMVITALMEW